MRIKKMITQDELSWYFSNFSSPLSKETYDDKEGESILILGIKRLMLITTMIEYIS